MFENEGMIYSTSEMSEINRDLLRLILLHSHLIFKLSDETKKSLFKELKELIINQR